MRTIPRSLVLALLATAACGDDKILWSDFRQVCDGTPVGRAPAYAKGGVSPIITFEKRFKEFRKPSAPVPEAWTSKTDVSKYQLVGCVTATKAEVVATCDYKGGRKLQIYDATYALEVREAATAKVLASTSVVMPAASRDCLLVKSFDSKVEGEFPDFRPALQALAEPIVMGR